MTRTLAALSAPLYFCAFVACAHNPYINRVVADGTASAKKYAFAYGGFCGPGFPPDAAEFTCRGELLLSLWPPKDDIAAACYAHDFCYVVGTKRTSCDLALFSVLHDHANALLRSDDPQDRQCYNLVSDMEIAFMLKFWEPSDSWLGSLSSWISRAALGLPLGGLAAVLRYPFRGRGGFPPEGTCNRLDNPNVHAVVAAFEEAYVDSVFNLNRRPLNVPTPEPNSPPFTCDTSPNASSRRTPSGRSPGWRR